MPESKQQLFHLLHHVDVTHDARYNPVTKTYSPRLEVAPATFAVTWPDGTPCGLVEIYLLHLWRSGEASIQPDGGSLRATVAKLTPLVRHCWSLKTDFWELEDADLQQLVADLQAEKKRRKPLERARNNNTVREIIAAAVRFLLWLQEHVVLDPSLIGVGRDFRIPLAERRVRDYRGRTKLVRVFHTLPPRATQAPKPPMSRESRDKLWQAVTEASLLEAIAPTWAARFPGEGELQDVLLYLKKRRELLLELLEATGARPGEFARLRVSENEACYQERKLVLDTLKRRREMNRQIPLQPGVAVKLEVFIRTYRGTLLKRLAERGIAASPQDRVFLGIGGRPLSERSMTTEFSQLAEAAGLGDYQTCMSMFRHRFITKQVAIHLEAFMDDNTKARSMMTDADYRTILKRVATITGHGSEASLNHYLDLAWEELGVFDRVDAATALDAAIERGLTGIIALRGDVEHGRRQPGLELLEAVKGTLADMHKQIRDALDTFVLSKKSGRNRKLASLSDQVRERS